MELWKQKLKNIGLGKEPVGILNEDITGVKSNDNGPDNLFYTEFDERDAEAFWEIFARFKEDSENNFALETLEFNLKEQIRVMPKGINPIEVILFAGRCVKEEIYSKRKLVNILKGIVTPRLRCSYCEKLAWHILGGWEWLAPICVFVESIGEINDDSLVRYAMRYYRKLADLGNRVNEKRIFEAYLNMIFATQNVSYNNYIVDIVTNENFVKDNDLTVEFLRRLKKEKYLNNEGVFSDLIDNICQRLSGQSEFKRNLSRLQSPTVQSSNSLLANVNSELSNEHKQREIEGLRFGASSRKSLAMIKSIKLSDGIIFALRKVMEDIADIYPEDQLGDAYILLGTKGQAIKSEVTQFLYSELAAKPNYILPIYIALVELDEMGYGELLKVIDESQYKRFWNINLGNYCRYRKRFLREELVSYVADAISSKQSVSEIKRKLFVLKEILVVYDGYDNKINNDTALIDALISMLSLIEWTDSDNCELYDQTLSILEVIRRSSMTRRGKVLQLLDIMKSSLGDRPELKTLEVRIDAMIRSLDIISAPQ